MDDAGIFKAIANFDASLEREALETLYRQVSGPVRRYVMANSGTAQEAEDVIQDAIIIFLNKVRLKELQHLTGKISTYIFAVARNNWLYQLRKKERMTLFRDENIPEDNGNLDTDGAIYGQILRQLMNLLPEPCKSIIEAFYLHRFSVREMAEMFGYKNENGMKKKKSLCMKSARALAVELLKKAY